MSSFLVMVIIKHSHPQNKQRSPLPVDDDHVCIFRLQDICDCLAELRELRLVALSWIARF